MRPEGVDLASLPLKFHAKMLSAEGRNLFEVVVFWGWVTQGGARQRRDPGLEGGIPLGLEVVEP